MAEIVVSATFTTLNTPPKAAIEFFVRACVLED
jgi:hypothetical protein